MYNNIHSDCFYRLKTICNYLYAFAVKVHTIEPKHTSIYNHLRYATKSINNNLMLVIVNLVAVAGISSLFSLFLLCLFLSPVSLTC